MHFKNNVAMFKAVLCQTLMLFCNRRRRWLKEEVCTEYTPGDQNEAKKQGIEPLKTTLMLLNP